MGTNMVQLIRYGRFVVSFPANFSPSVRKSTYGNPPIPRYFNHCMCHVVHCTLTAMQSYVTSHVKLKYANIPAYLNQNGIGGLPDVLFPMEGEKSAGNETSRFESPYPRICGFIHIFSI